jgi:imidazolonepropionase-like amidohydrolase
MARAASAVLLLLPTFALPAAAQHRLAIRCGHVLSPDGASFRTDVDVVVEGGAIALRPRAEGAAVDVDYGDAFLIPGLVDLHTHLLLRPYDQATWERQVLHESLELRTIRATAAAAATLRAGFLHVRDLGTEGANLADVALRTAIADGIVPGPRIFASTRAIVATGCYGPNLPTAEVPKGAQVADGPDGVRRAVREQVAAGADWIKVYADYRRAPGADATPTFTSDELRALCDEARTAGIPVAAHASTDEGIRRAVEAGVRTIEHGTGAGDATLQLVRERGVVLCPCLAANEAIVRQAGHRGPVARRLDTGRIAFQRALAAGVTIGCGSDAGVFAHGDNARELELMVEYGMTPAQALASATTTAAAVLGRTDLGRIADGARPGLVVLAVDPLQDIGALRAVVAVIPRDQELRIAGR